MEEIKTKIRERIDELEREIDVLRHTFPKENLINQHYNRIQFMMIDCAKSELQNILKLIE